MPEVQYRYLGCNIDTDCKNGEKCDPYDHICKKPCGDCKPHEICDENTKLCVHKCDDDDECKGENYYCDRRDTVCRPRCTPAEDCQAYNMTCDTNNGFCVHGEFLTLNRVAT